MAPRIVDSVLDLVGSTPLIRLQRIVPQSSATVLGKLEALNPGGSVKDRICLSMVEDAERAGRLRPGMTIVEPTSGNTGIGLAMVCAVKGYQLILTMPESMSFERRALVMRYGAKVELTRAELGMTGAVDRAREIVERDKNAIMLQQFENPANPEAHRRTTAQEILEATGGDVDAFVTGVGTGGTLTGVAEVLKAEIPHVWVVAVEPASSAVLSGGECGPHRIEGIGAGFVPAVLNRDVIDEVIPVTDEDAFATSDRLTSVEGLMVGLSAGANVWASLQVAQRLGPGRTVVTVLPDTGTRYFSVHEYFRHRSRSPD